MVHTLKIIDFLELLDQSHEVILMLPKFKANCLCEVKTVSGDNIENIFLRLKFIQSFQKKDDEK